MRGSPSYGGDDGFFSHRHGRRAVESRSHWGSLDFRGTFAVDLDIHGKPELAQPFEDRKVECFAPG